MKYATIIERIFKNLYSDAVEVEVTDTMRWLSGAMDDHTDLTTYRGYLWDAYGAMMSFDAGRLDNGIRYFVVHDNEDMALYIFNRGETTDNVAPYYISYEERYVLYENATINSDYKPSVVLNKIIDHFANIPYKPNHEDMIESIIHNVDCIVPTKDELIEYLLIERDILKRNKR